MELLLFQFDLHLSGLLEEQAVHQRVKVAVYFRHFECGGWGSVNANGGLPDGAAGQLNGCA